MAVKVEGGLKKGTLVYMRHEWGPQRGQVDEEHLYQIRMLGKKQCTLDRVDKVTLQKTWRRGQNVYLVEREEAERRNEENRRNTWNSTYHWSWSQKFVLVGEAGWDPDQNF